MEKYKVLVKGVLQHEDKYLIVKRWYDDNITEPYRWEFIDGKLEFGEDPERGVIRLIQEQTGLDAEVGKVLYTWSFMVGEVWNIGISYLCITSMELTQVILSEELNDYKWIRRDEFEYYIENKRVLDDIGKTDLW